MNPTTTATAKVGGVEDEPAVSVTHTHKMAVTTKKLKIEMFTDDSINSSVIRAVYLLDASSTIIAITVMEIPKTPIMVSGKPFKEPEATD
jgi:hypothetical protein